MHGEGGRVGGEEGVREVRWREMEFSYFILYSAYHSKCVFMHTSGKGYHNVLYLCTPYGAMSVRMCPMCARWLQMQRLGMSGWVLRVGCD